MGCYPFSLLSYFNFDLKNFKIRYKIKKKRLNLFEVFFYCKNIKFNIFCGVFQKYENFLKINYKNLTSYQFNYVFYGKKITKENYYYNGDIKKINNLINPLNVQWACSPSLQLYARNVWVSPLWSRLSPQLLMMQRQSALICKELIFWILKKITTVSIPWI